MNLALFTLGLVLPISFIIGVTGFSQEPNYYVLWIGLPLLLFGVRIRPTPAHWIGLALVAWATLSLLWTPQASFAGDTVLRLGAVVLAFLIGAEISAKPMFWGMWVGLMLNTLLAIYQWSQGTFISGLLFNSNALTEPAGLVALWFVLGGNPLGALLAPALILPGTRAGLLALGVGLGYWLWQRSKLAAILVVVVLTYAGWGSRPSSTTERVGVWTDTYTGLTVLGHGLGSFAAIYPKYSVNIDINKARPFHAHSDILEVTFELGIPGLALFLALLAAIWFQAAPRWHPLLAACYILIAVDFPLFVPTTGFIIAFVAGRAAAGWRDNGMERVARRPWFYASDVSRRLLRVNQGKRKVSV